MFLDEVIIEIQSGKGGDGCVSFRREKYIEKGGPDGGNGGDGGSVFFRGKQSINTLNYFKYHKKFKAESGQAGQSKQKFGRNGKDLIIDVPLGTIIRCDTRDTIEILTAGQCICIANGGRGGKGNVHFKSSVNRAPRQFQHGEQSVELKVQLELNIIADVGLIGLPNAGKSSLIQSLTNSKSKIGEFPFTTIEPQLGVVYSDDFRSLIIADLPGLVKNAYQGAGMGHLFLKHVNRNHILLHIIDCSVDVVEVINNYNIIVSEIKQFNAELIARQSLVVLTKLDLITDKKNHLQQIKQLLLIDVPIIAVSAKDGTGLSVLKQKLFSQP